MIFINTTLIFFTKIYIAHFFFYFFGFFCPTNLNVLIFFIIWNIQNCNYFSQNQFFHDFLQYKTYLFLVFGKNTFLFFFFSQEEW